MTIRPARKPEHFGQISEAEWDAFKKVMGSRFSLNAALMAKAVEVVARQNVKMQTTPWSAKRIQLIEPRRCCAYPLNKARAEKRQVAPQRQFVPKARIDPSPARPRARPVSDTGSNQANTAPGESGTAATFR